MYTSLYKLMQEANFHMPECSFIKNGSPGKGHLSQRYAVAARCRTEMGYSGMCIQMYNKMGYGAS